MDTAGSPQLLPYPLAARESTRDSTLVVARGLRCTVEVHDGPERSGVGELARPADEVSALVAPTGKTIG